MGLDKGGRGMLGRMEGLLFVERPESVIDPTLWIKEGHIDSAYCRQQKRCSGKDCYRYLHVDELRC
jgi:hypothetical protein